MTVLLAALRSIRPSLTAFRAATPSEHSIKRLAITPVAPISTANLEVERKFNLNLALDSELKKHYQQTKSASLGRGPDPHAANLQFAPKGFTYIQDEYFDFYDTLASKGIWVRKRSVDHAPAMWEAKVKIGGDYQNSEFEEVRGSPGVVEAVKHLVPFSKLQSTVKIMTGRQSWMARDHFLEATVVTDFCNSPTWGVPRTHPHDPKTKAYWGWEHAIGEVELTRSIEVSGDIAVDHAKKVEASTQMREELREFMLRHGKYFPTSPTPPGKLTSFFIWKKNFGNHVERLE